MLVIVLCQLCFEFAHHANHRLEGRTAIARHFAADQIIGLNTSRPFVNRRNTGIAQMLRGTCLFHVAHAAMHLYPGRRYVDADLGAPALDHRNHQLDKSHVLLAHGRVRVPERLVVRCRDHIGQRPTRLGQRLHAHQHAPHVRMHDDRHFRAATHTHFVALNTLFGVISRPLIGAFAHRHTLHADTETRHVHHDEHVLKTMVLLADQIPHRPALVAKGHYRRRAGMNPHFVFNRRTPGIVT